jgi:hypothetical protein
MYNTEQAPRVSQSLIKFLRQHFPKRSYEPSMSQAEIMHEEGKQAMIDVLERIAEDQSKK